MKHGVLRRNYGVDEQTSHIDQVTLSSHGVYKITHEELFKVFYIKGQ